MTLNDEGTGDGLQIVPETYGMGVPSACTIVIIAGKIKISCSHLNFSRHLNATPGAPVLPSISHWIRA